MKPLFGRRRRTVTAPSITPRQSKTQTVNRVSLAELTPDLPRYLGQAAYLQLSNFETITGAIASSPTTRDKLALTRVARVALTKLEGLLEEIERGGDRPEELMEHFAAPIDAFRAATRGADWHETVVTSYVTASMLTDFFASLADGLPPGPRGRIQHILSADPSHIVVEQLRVAIDAQPQLASRLALWGRRLVGDTLLVARSSLAVSGAPAPDDARLEPVFTELIAAHTRRMDVLGLTA